MTSERRQPGRTRKQLRGGVWRPPERSAPLRSGCSCSSAPRPALRCAPLRDVSAAGAAGGRAAGAARGAAGGCSRCLGPAEALGPGRPLAPPRRLEAAGFLRRGSGAPEAASAPSRPPREWPDVPQHDSLPWHLVSLSGAPFAWHFFLWYSFSWHLSPWRSLP